MIKIVRMKLAANNAMSIGADGEWAIGAWCAVGGWRVVER